jgi:hypothetical protein
MIKKITAIIAAAACAGFVVASVAGFAPEVAASAPKDNRAEAAKLVIAGAFAELAAPIAAANRTGVEQRPPGGSRNRKIACVESWPYYEPSCLQDDRPPDGRGRIVRMISERTRPGGFSLGAH